MAESAETNNVKHRINAEMEQLTSGERKIANVILADYPYGGLMTIQELAKRAHVSAPSITRFISKLGYGGYQDFQRQLIGELKQRELSPIQLKLTESPSSGSHFLTDYARRLVSQLTTMAEGIPPQQFDDVCKIIADPSRNIFILGGRVTDSVAQFLAIHLRQIRGRIYHIPADPELWPEYVLRMRKQDVLILFDVRRYQPRLEQLAKIVSEERQTTIIAITDKWISPIASNAKHVFAVPVELETAWDTVVCLITVVEAMIIRVSEADWAATRKRIETWDRVRFSLQDISKYNRGTKSNDE